MQHSKETELRSRTLSNRPGGSPRVVRLRRPPISPLLAEQHDAFTFAPLMPMAASATTDTL